MPYTPTTWVNGSGGGTPISAANLNNIEDGIVDLEAALAAAIASAVGTELRYDQITSNVSITATTEGTANTVIAGTSTAYDATKKRIECWIGGSLEGTGALIGVLLRGATVLGQFRINDAAANQRGAVMAVFYDTPSAGSHTYAVKAFTGGGSGTILAGAGGAGAMLPAFLRISKA